MRYHAPPSLLAQPGRSQNWAMDSRRQALNLLGRTQGLELSEADRRRDAVFRVMDAYAAMKQRKKAEEAAEDSGGFFGSGGGAAVGSLAGMGVGALAGGVPGALVGGMVGGAGGGVADIAVAPGSRGAAAGNQQVANLPRNLMGWDQYYGAGAQEDRRLAQEQQGARTALLEAQTAAANRSHQPLTRDVVDNIVDGYLQRSGRGGTTAQQEKALPGAQTYTSPFGLQPQYPPAARLPPRTGWDGKPLPYGVLDF